MPSQLQKSYKGKRIALLKILLNAQLAAKVRQGQKELNF